MARFLYRPCAAALRKIYTIFLALFWLAGLGIGALLFRYVCNPFASWMRMASVCHMSIVGLLGSLLLPFLFSAFAVFIGYPRLIYPVCFLKAISFGYICCSITAAFDQSGWLIRSLLLFADQISILLLFVYWQQYVSGERAFHAGKSCVTAGVICLIAVVDFHLVAPFLNRLMIL